MSEFSTLKGFQELLGSGGVAPRGQRVHGVLAHVVPWTEVVWCWLVAKNRIRILVLEF